MKVVATTQEANIATRFKRDAKIILADTVKGLLSIPFGPAYGPTQDDAPAWLHWCADCQHYHRYR